MKNAGVDTRYRRESSKLMITNAKLYAREIHGKPVEDGGETLSTTLDSENSDMPETRNIGYWKKKIAIKSRKYIIQSVKHIYIHLFSLVFFSMYIQLLCQSFQYLQTRGLLLSYFIRHRAANVQV